MKRFRLDPAEPTAGGMRISVRVRKGDDCRVVEAVFPEREENGVAEAGKELQVAIPFARVFFEGTISWTFKGKDKPDVSGTQQRDNFASMRHVALVQPSVLEGLRAAMVQEARKKHATWQPDLKTLKTELFPFGDGWFVFDHETQKRGPGRWRPLTSDVLKRGVKIWVGELQADNQSSPSPNDE